MVISVDVSSGGETEVVRTDAEDTTDILRSFPVLAQRSALLVSDVMRVEGDQGQGQVSCLYVGQRELAVVGPADQIDILGSDSASTCLVVLLRDPVTGVAGLAHLDTPSEDRLSNQLVDLLEATRQRLGSQNLQLEVSLFGGYNDEAGLSRRISSMILRTMQSSPESFILRHLCCGEINTLTRPEGPRPAVWGGGLSLRSGAVFCAQFTRRLPDLDIRSLRLYSTEKHLVSVYNGADQTLVIKPFTYSVPADLESWARKSDDYLLRVLSTSPAAEPEHFCQAVRATLRRMMRNPQPLLTLFPGGQDRVYTLNRRTGDWRLVGTDLANSHTQLSHHKHRTWGLRDFKMAFS